MKITLFAGEEYSFNVNASIDKTVITIGEKIRYTVEVIRDERLTIQMPEIVDNLGGFAINDFGPIPTEKVGKKLIKEGQWYELDTYLVGTYIIPEFKTLAVTPEDDLLSVKTPEIYLEVKSVIRDDDELRDIRDIKGPVGIPLKPWFVIMIVSVVLGLLVGFFLVLRKYVGRSRRKNDLEALLPHEVALIELNRIEALNLLVAGKIKEYYFLLTDCLRTYLEKRFLLNALEMTTEEFMEHILSLELLQGDEKKTLQDILSHCDFVKFAKYEPESSETEKVFQAVQNFVNDTKLDEVKNREVLSDGF